MIGRETGVVSVELGWHRRVVAGRESGRAPSSLEIGRRPGLGNARSHGFQGRASRGSAVVFSSGYCVAQRSKPALQETTDHHLEAEAQIA